MFNATMDFGLGEDIDALRETVRKFALEEIAPKSAEVDSCLLYTSPSPRDGLLSRMPSSA